ncbi:hydroxysqualene dehydroxylase [Sandaracinus amylolyticus]|uniref:Phi-Carotenoid synthase n=1 Tax=Sandaracinus amylolyticus TaxID=927083 RepID=A0A0F6WA97_9BACT|nr:phi-Carotenoid synthase [Sandaracinus amylolyticus]
MTGDRLALAPRPSLAERLGLGRREVRGAFRGTRERAEPGTRVAVIGGGIAGTSAACVLAERGVEVVLVEKEPFLGGRLAAWSERLPDGQHFMMERAFPAFHRHYYNLRAILRRIDPELASLEALPDYPILGPDGTTDSFAGLPTTAPLNLISLFRRTPWLTLNDLRKIDGESFRAMLTFDPIRSYGELDDRSARDWLDRLALPPRAREMLFRVFSRSVFNREEAISAAEMISRLHFYFLGNPEGLRFDVLEEPTSDVLWKPMERYLARHGVELRMGVSATKIERDKIGATRVHLEDGSIIACDGAVLATCVPALRELVARSPDLHESAEFARSIDSLTTSAPFAVLRLFLDRPASPDRLPHVNVAGLGALDQITIFDRFEGESRRWARRHGGTVIQLQAVALAEGREERAVRNEMVSTLRAVYAELSDANVLHEVMMVRQDQPGFAPGSHATRPRVVTPYGNLVLAGDYVKLPFPTALMERAAASGLLAANQLLDRWDVRGEPVWSIPPRGFIASMRFAGSPGAT